MALMITMTRIAVAAVFLAALSILDIQAQNSDSARSVDSPRLYVLDGGVLASDPGRYDLRVEDVEVTELSIASFLVVHPDGVLLWDAGAVAEGERMAGGAGTEQRLVRQDGNERFVTLGPSLIAQLAESGYTPEDVTHLALSHYHWDHTADAGSFARATWLVAEREREVMLAAEPPGGTRPSTFDALRSSEVVLLGTDEHDVFGDGKVIIKQAPGHTEGHLVLFVDLENTGAVLLSGDLYHYPAERTLNRLPDFEASPEETVASRESVERLLERTGAALWIQHDLAHHRTLRLAPAYYD